MPWKVNAPFAPKQTTPIQLHNHIMVSQSFKFYNKILHKNGEIVCIGTSCHMLKIHKNWSPLKIFNNINMHWNPRLVINACDFMTIYKNEVNLLDSRLCGCQDHIIHAFYHALVVIACSIFVWCVLHLEKLKQIMHNLKVSHGSPYCKKMEDINKL